MSYINKAEIQQRITNLIELKRKDMAHPIGYDSKIDEYRKQLAAMENTEELQPYGELSIFPDIRRIVSRCKTDHSLIGGRLFTHPLEKIIGGQWNEAELHNFMVKLVFAPDMDDETMFDFIIDMVEKEEKNRLMRRK